MRTIFLWFLFTTESNSPLSSTRLSLSLIVNKIKGELGNCLSDTVPICDSQIIILFTVEGEEDELIIEFLNLESLIEENKPFVPGRAVFSEGFFCIGLEKGIGDPYAEGNNPPVYLLLGKI